MMLYILFAVVFKTLAIIEVLACNEGRFGPNCEGVCHCNDGNDKCNGEDGHCVTGVCAMGWTGVPFCQSACPSGTFGMMCSKTCHCPEGDTCSQINGLCQSGGCLYGWAGPSCQTRLPVYSCPPNVTVVSDTAMKVSWRRWSNVFDQGTGPIAFYQLQYHAKGQGPWTTINTRPEAPDTKQYDFTVTGLTPNAMYSFRLLLAMRLEEKYQVSVPGPVSPYKRTVAQTAAQIAAESASTGSPDTPPTRSQRTADINASPPPPSHGVPPASDVRLIATTPSSLTIAWHSQVAESNAYVNQIRVLMVESYTAEPHTSDKVYTTHADNLDIPDLAPASLYSIEISTVNTVTLRESVPISERFWTIQEPLPTPPQPIILNVTESKIYVIIYPLEDATMHVSYYDVIVEDMTQVKEGHDLEELVEDGASVEISDYETAILQNLSFYVSHRSLAQEVFENGTLVVIGDGSTQGGLLNGPLRSMGVFSIWLSAVSRLGDVTDRSFSKAAVRVHPASGRIESASALSAGAIAGIVFAVAIAIVALVILVYYLWSKWPLCEYEFDTYLVRERITAALPSASFVRNPFRKSPREKRLHFITSTPIGKRHVPLRDDFRSIDKIDIAGTGIETRVPPRIHDVSRATANKSKPILVKQLAEFVQTQESSVCPLSEEFKHLPVGITESVHVATRAENRVRNRYPKTLAFDKNRIRLRDVGDPRRSDYINASLVKSHMHRFYVVTQSPMVSTMADFWRMVWERRVDTIVMLLSLRDSQQHFEQYWPDKHKGEQAYSDILVENVLEINTAYYDMRWLRVSERTGEDLEERSVVHFQYKVWSYSGTPHHPIPFLDMMTRVREFHVESQDIVVHCQGGAGRSGLYVALDSLLHEAKSSGKVDVLRCVTTLRQERPNMVKTLKQYRFLFDALLEALHFRETRLAASRFCFILDSLLSASNRSTPSLLAAEYEAVVSNQRKPGLNKSFQWTDYSTFHTPSRPESRNLTVTSRTLALQPDNACFMIAYLDSHKYQNNFVITHYPNQLQSVFKFWDLVQSERCPGIVLITDNTVLHTPYWPAQGGHAEFENCAIRTITTRMDRSETSYIRDIELIPCRQLRKKKAGTGGAGRVLRQFQFSPWAHAKEAPPLYAILEFVNHVRDWYYAGRHVRPLVVQATQGVSRAALFCVLWVLLERLEEEEVVDVYRATRYAKCYVQAAVTNLEQYKFLYRAVKEHLLHGQQINQSEQSDASRTSCQRAKRNFFSPPNTLQGLNRDAKTFHTPSQALYTIPNHMDTTTDVSDSGNEHLSQGPDSTYIRVEDPIYDEITSPVPLVDIHFGVNKQYADTRPVIGPRDASTRTHADTRPVIGPRDASSRAHANTSPVTGPRGASTRAHANTSPVTGPRDASTRAHANTSPVTGPRDASIRTHANTSPVTGPGDASTRTQQSRRCNGSTPTQQPQPCKSPKKKPAPQAPTQRDILPNRSGRDEQNPGTTPKTVRGAVAARVSNASDTKRPAPGRPNSTDTTSKVPHGTGAIPNRPNASRGVQDLDNSTDDRAPVYRKLFLSHDQHYAHYKEAEATNSVNKSWIEVPNDYLYIDDTLFKGRQQEIPEPVYANAGVFKKTDNDSKNEQDWSPANEALSPQKRPKISPQTPGRAPSKGRKASNAPQNIELVGESSRGGRAAEGKLGNPDTCATEQKHRVQDGRETSRQTIRGGKSRALPKGKSRASRKGKSQATREGKSQATHEGSSQATCEGNSQATHEGSSQATCEGNSQATREGKSWALRKGKSQATREGSSQATHEGNSQATREGKSKTTCQGKSQTIHNGKPDTTRATHEGKTHMSHDGKTKSTHHGKTQVTRDGNLQMSHDGKSQSSSASFHSAHTSQLYPSLPGSSDSDATLTDGYNIAKARDASAPGDVTGSGHRMDRSGYSNMYGSDTE